MISTETNTIDHHRSNETLRERENYLKTIFNSVQTGLLVIDPETHSIFDVNPKAAELIGLDRSKIIGSVCHQFVCPAEKGRCPITDLGQKIDNSERILLKADGSRIPIIKTGIPITIDGHDYILESFFDISERKILERDLQESETKFRDLAERALVGIYLIQDGIFKYVNPKFAEIHGYSVAEMLGILGPKDVIYPDDCPVAAENIRKRLSGESQSIRYETRIVTKNGDIRSVELFGSRTIFQGRPGVVGTALDTTERKKAYEALKKSEERLNMTLDAVNDGIWEWNLQTNDTVFNPRYFTMLGYEPDEFPQNYASWKSLIHPDDLDRAEQDIKRSTDSGRSFAIEIRMRTKSGDWRWILSRGMVVERDPEGHPVRMLGTHSDITGSKQAEEALREAKIAAEESRAQYEQVVSMISDIVWRYDVDLQGQFVASYITPVADRMLGLPDGTIGNSFDKFFSYVHPDDLPAVQKLLYDSISELAKEYVIDFRLRKADGTTIWVRAKGSAYSLPDSKITAFGTTSDITESKKAEEAIGESHKRLTDILDSIDSLVYVADFNSHELLFLNKYGREIWGEVQRRKCWQVFQKGQKGPCSFCTNDKLVSDAGISTGVCQWEFQNTVNGRWYECRDQAIPWAGKTLVRMEIATDITGRKQAEEALQKAKLVAETSRAQFEQVVSMISDVIWRHDINAEGEYIGSYISPAADRMLGLPEGSIRNNLEKFFSYIHPEDSSTVQKAFSEDTRTLVKDFTREFRMLKKDGATIWVRARGSTYTQPDGRITVFGTTSDISERKRAEEALRETKDYLETLIDYANAPIIVWDSSFKITRFNHAFERLTQKNSVDVLGKNLEILFPEDSKVRSLEYIKRTSSGERWEVVEIPILRSDVSVRIVLWNSANIYDKDGTTILTTIAQGQDITERKSSEDAIKESQRRLTDIIDFLPDATFAVDKAGLVIAWNRAMEEMTGIGRNEMLGQGDHAYTVPFYGKRRPQLLDLLDKDDNEIASNYQYVQRKGNSLYAEAFTPALRQGKGAYVWATTGPIFDVLGNRVGAIESIRDITERKYEQDELKNNLRFLETLIETIPSPIFFLDRQGRYLGCNNSFAQQIVGMPKENIIGKTVFELPDAIPTDLADRYYEQDQKLFRELGTQEYEMEVQCSDGEKRDFFFTKATFKNYTGDVAGIVGVMLDVTKRKQAELSLESSIIRQKRLNRLQSALLAPAKLEQKLKMITGGVVDIFGADFCRIWITSPGDLCEAGCKHAEVTDGPHVCRYRDRCLRLLASSGRYTHTDGEGHRRVPFGCYKIGLVASGEEHKFLTNDVQNDPRVHNHEWAEEIGLVSFAGYQLRPPGGDTVGVLALFSKQNITSEDDAQLDNLSNMTALLIQADRIDGDLRASNQIIEGIINAIPLRVFWKDENLVFLGCNAAFAHDAGFADSKDIVGKDDYQMGWHDQADLYRSDDRQIIESGRSKIFVEEPQTTPEGNTIVLLTSKVPLRSSEGEIVGVIGTYMDITDRKQAEEALKEAKLAAEESRAQYVQVVSMISDVVWSCDVDAMGKYVGSYISPVADRMLCVPDGTIGNSFDKFFLYIHPDDLPEVQKKLSEVIRTHVKDVNVEYRLQRADGATIWVRSRASAYAQPDGRITAFGTTSDITELKQMETAQRESKEYLDKIINSISDPIFVIDRQHRHVLVNKAMCEMSNRPCGEFIGKTPYDFFPKEQVDVFLQKDEVVFETGIENVNEETITDSHGVVRTIITKKTLYTDTSGNKSIVGIINDITDRKKAEEKLKSAHDQLLAIIDFLPDATFVIDKDGAVIAWNRAIEVMTDIRAEDILGKGNYEYAIPFYGERRPVLIDLLLQQVKEIEDKYVRIERKDEVLEGEAYMPNMKAGAVYLYGKAAVLYDSTGNLYGAIESIRDVTERKNAEQVRERLVKELESKNAEMERFTYTVSHDLRSPLITVSGLVGFLKSDLDKGNITRTTTFLERITNAIAKMDNLLKDTLELSRIGRVANPPEKVAFDDIVQDALSQVQERITKSGTKITVAEAMPDVFVDKMRIVEVMVNLIENGIKYMGDQAHPEIEIGHRIMDGQHTFFVKDNGMGIDPSQFDKVFELFYKVNAKSEGTGAGLAIVKRIIEVQGGRIWVESENGKGSTFCFNLPLQPSEGV